MAVEVVWAKDFAKTTQEILEQAHHSEHFAANYNYSTERLGGEAVAKNIAITADSSLIKIVLNKNMLSMAFNEATIATIFVIAHELTHPIIDRTRAKLGILDGVNFPSKTPTEYARSISRSASDEYWADHLASIILGTITTATPSEGGEKFKLNHGHVYGGTEDYRQQISRVLDSHIYPGWPRRTLEYRVGNIDLDTLWEKTLTETDQVITLLAHSQACEDNSGKNNSVFTEQITKHKAFRLYLGPAWQKISDSLRSMPIALGIDGFAESDLAITNAGEIALKEMWKNLGISFRDEKPEEGSYYIDVCDPVL